ncbi:hypothetical protein [uncultured Friedmanniella sp.]|uniref:hypothetical protein n=1 Tax=uncultured Friedmanniella sp. TaxID=335381 RepID=UPI0035CA8355
MTAFPQQPSPQTGLVLDLRKPFGGIGLINPVVAIDGYPAQAVWGPNFYPAPVGRRHVRVSTRYLWEYGAAETDVDVYPGQTAVVHYTPPWLTFVSGRIGPTPQPRRGAVLVGVMLVVVVLLVVLSIVGASMGS